MPPKDYKEPQFYIQTPDGEMYDVRTLEMCDITETVDAGGRTSPFIHGDDAVEFVISTSLTKSRMALWRSLLILSGKSNNWLKMHGYPIIRRSGRRKK